MRPEFSLALILFFAFIIRFWNLEHPKAYIFDEVYHGFTAQEMAKGNVKAWEWWNTPPQGFAYEWTHPPLAKLFMAAGVLVFGQSQFAFRFPAVIFGTGIVLLTYLLAKQIFKKQKLALLAAFLISFDNLMLTMSRVGMADIYFLFFLLATILLTLKEKYLWSGIALGLAIATKWTGIYLYPVAGIILLGKFFHLRGVKNSSPRRCNLTKHLLNLFSLFTVYYLLFTILIYLLSYLPFFTSGHSLSQFQELQRQMWWYHTNLKATHSYQSKAYTWPFMLRPVWFWVDYKPESIGNIYNLGNPFLWWTGVLILPYVIWQAVRQFLHLGGEKLRHLQGVFLVIFCYFIFWLPWIVSPRIMFLHHYLPALPFLCILVAYFLNQLENWKLEIGNWKLNGRLLTISYQLLTIITFFFFYPISTGILIPKNMLKFWFWLASWK